MILAFRFQNHGSSMLGRSSPVPQSFNLTAPFCKSSLAQSTFDQTGHHQWAWLLSSRRRRGISSCLSISRGGEAWTFCQAWSMTSKLSSQGQGHLLQRQFGPFAKSRWRKAQCSIAILPSALVIPSLGEGEQQGLIKTSRLSKQWWIVMLPNQLVIQTSPQWAPAGLMHWTLTSQLGGGWKGIWSITPTRLSAGTSSSLKTCRAALHSASGFQPGLTRNFWSFWSQMRPTFSAVALWTARMCAGISG